MRFSIISTVVTVATCVAAVPTKVQERGFQVPAGLVVKYLNQFAARSEELAGPASELSLENAPLMLEGKGPWPEVIQGLGEFVTAAAAGSSKMSPTSYNEKDSAAIAEASEHFVTAQTELLDTLASKAELVKKLPFVAPEVGAVLKLVESATDSIAVILIDSVHESAHDTLQEELDILNESIDNAVAAYSAKPAGPAW